ncbi:MAG: SDR family oxidoreductase, partial [Bacteroidales bacterium]|nr:SDR family oxidoreductase [Bacteroidales bacterium]
LEEGGSAELLPFDVSSPEEVDTALKSWNEGHPGEHVDVLVNNAGIVRDSLFLEMELEQWKEVMDTDLNSFFYVTRRVLEDMLVAHHGRVVNISSIAGQMGFCGQVNYSAAKAALIGATRSLAAEVAPKGITVNAVAPSLVDTDMAVGADISKVRNLVPMRRMGKPEEVAYLVSFLASDKASFITGQVIGINGGLI